MIITVKFDRMDGLVKKLNKIQKSFKDHGGDFKYKVIKSYIKEINKGTNFQTKGGYTWNKVGVMVSDIEIIGDLENNLWSVIGIAERQFNNEVTISNINDANPVPESFYGSEIRCDHCHTNRRRDQGVIIQNKDTKEYKMVGTTCLTDYTGIALEALEALFGVKEFETEPKKRLVSTEFTMGKYIYNVEETMCVTSCFMDYIVNFLKKRYSLFTLTNWTKYSVYALHCPTKATGVNKKDYTTGVWYSSKIQEDPITKVNFIKEVRDWVENLDPHVELTFSDSVSKKTLKTSDILNLKTIVHQEYVKVEDVNKLVLAICLYDYLITEKDKRELERKEAEEAEERRKEWERQREEARKIEEAKRAEQEAREARAVRRTVGENFTVAIRSCEKSDIKQGPYGSYVTLKFFGEDDNKYILFSSPKMSIVNNYNTFKELSGKIKSFGIYHGEKTYFIKEVKCA